MLRSAALGVLLAAVVVAESPEPGTRTETKAGKVPGIVTRFDFTKGRCSIPLINFYPVAPRGKIREYKAPERTQEKGVVTPPAPPCEPAPTRPAVGSATPRPLPPRSPSP